MAQSSILNVHTPTSSFSIIHSLNQDSLTTLSEKLTKKVQVEYDGQRVGPGWLKYEYNGTIWDLDDDSDYAIFVWRQQQHDSPTNDSTTIPSIAIGEPGPSRLSPPSNSTTTEPAKPTSTPTLHLHNPTQALPSPRAYRNPSYYKFRPVLVPPKISPAPSSTGRSSQRSSRKKEEEEGDGVPKLMKQFEKFHSENGVRTVMGSIGSVHNVRMLLKAGYRHVYMSRRFAQKHGFIPRDASPGYYGYSGLVNIGTWPITLVTSSSSSSHAENSHHTQHDNDDVGHNNGRTLIQPSGKAGAVGLGIVGLKPETHRHRHGRKSPAPSHYSNSAQGNDLLHSFSKSPPAPPFSNGANNGVGGKSLRHQERPGPDQNGKKPTVTNIQVYLSEEPHFDVVLGRSFFEKRQIKMSSIDPTEVICLDTGEKVECEVVILKDGRGEIVTVT